MSECSSCGAPIRWAMTANGKPMPLDFEPVSNGNVVVRHGRAIIAGMTILEPNELRYVSHFATCPNAASHRR